MKSRGPALGTQPRCLQSEPALKSCGGALVPHRRGLQWAQGTRCREGWVNGCVHKTGCRLLFYKRDYRDPQPPWLLFTAKCVCWCIMNFPRRQHPEGRTKGPGHELLKAKPCSREGVESPAVGEPSGWNPVEPLLSQML